MSSKKSSEFTKINSLLDKYRLDSTDKYISREFQKYGYELAKDLNDLRHKSLYIKLAKENERGLLESAKSFAKDAEGAKSKGALFMWKLAELKKQRSKKHETKKR